MVRRLSIKSSVDPDVPAYMYNRQATQSSRAVTWFTRPLLFKAHILHFPPEMATLVQAESVVVLLQRWSDT